MSVIVKGMKMPKSCRDCLFTQLNVGAIAQNECFINKKMNDQYTYVVSKRPDWCPLVELPEKHGRLIDKDKLQTKVNALVDKFETISEKCYHPDAYFDSDKCCGRYRAYAYKADGAEAALQEIIGADTIIERGE